MKLRSLLTATLLSMSSAVYAQQPLIKDSLQVNLNNNYYYVTHLSREEGVNQLVHLARHSDVEELFMNDEQNWIECGVRETSVGVGLNMSLFLDAAKRPIDILLVHTHIDPDSVQIITSHGDIQSYMDKTYRLAEDSLPAHLLYGHASQYGFSTFELKDRSYLDSLAFFDKYSMLQAMTDYTMRKSEEYFKELVLGITDAKWPYAPTHITAFEYDSDKIHFTFTPKALSNSFATK